MRFVPILHRLHWRSAPQSCLRQRGVVEVDIAHQGLLQIKGTVEAVGFQHVADAAVEAFDHAIGLGRLGRCSMPNSAQSRSNSCAPDGALARQEKSRSVNSFPLSVNILAIRMGQARCKLRKNLRALAAVLAGRMRAKPHLVARSMAAKR